MTLALWSCHPDQLHYRSDRISKSPPNSQPAPTPPTTPTLSLPRKVQPGLRVVIRRCDYRAQHTLLTRKWLAATLCSSCWPGGGGRHMQGKFHGCRTWRAARSGGRWRDVLSVYSYAQSLFASALHLLTPVAKSCFGPRWYCNTQPLLDSRRATVDHFNNT